MTTSPKAKTMELMEQCALAALRAELDLIPKSQVSAVRQLLAEDPDSFDGERLIALCLEGRLPEGGTELGRAFNALRERFAPKPVRSASGRRRAGFIKRKTATLTAKLIFSLLYTVVLVALLYVVQYHWHWANLYDLGNEFVDWLSSF